MTEIRRSLKKWENAFFSVHQRKPSKSDINEAPEKIKDLYRAYHAAKKNEESIHGGQKVDGADEPQQDATSASVHPSSSSNSDLSSLQSLESVWGPELNRNVCKSPEKGDKNADKKGGNLLDKFGEKLAWNGASSSGTAISLKKRSSFCRQDSSPAHRIPRSSLQPSLSLSSSQVIQEITGQNSESDCSDFRLKGELFEKAFRLSTSKKHLAADDTLVPTKFVKPDKPRRHFSLSQKVNMDGFCLDGYKYSSADSFDDDGVLSVEDEESRRRIGGDANLSGPLAGEIRTSSEFACPMSATFSCADGPSHEENGEISRNSLKDSNLLQDTGVAVSHVTGKTVEQLDIKTGSKPSRRRGITQKSENSHKSISSIVGPDSPGREGLQMRQTSDVFVFDQDDKRISEKKDQQPPVPGSERDEGALPKRAVKRGRAPVKRKAESSVSRPQKRKKKCEKEDKEAESECLSAADHEEETAVNHTLPVKPKAVRKPSTSAACKAENFVRLNMKAKKFVRKGARMTGAQWKRKQWKQKMAARSESFGSDKCFKCGQKGHWANKCPQKGSISQLSMGEGAASVDENDFPSLRAAALMARGVKVTGDDCGSDEEMAVEAMVVREKHEPDVTPQSATPLSQLISDVDSEMEKGLKKFGFSSFRPGQKETIRRIIHGQSTLVILSTGGGKSLCYQLPAYLYAQHAPGITLVVSPLVSLMEDQITGLPPGIRGACLNSSMTGVQRDGVLSDINSGKVHFLLVSPEAVVGGGGRGQGSFPSADKLPPIFFACVDEVHCLSEWSHNFRPSYLRLCKVLREKYGVKCFLGLTATATTSTARDVVRHLDIPDVDAATIRGSPVPPNLCLSVSRDENKDEALVSLLQGKRFSQCCSIIIYCTRREQVERVATLLRTCLQTLAGPKKKKGAKSSAADQCDSWTIESYHAGLTPAQRKRVQKAFMSGSLRVVVATVAFGMGLDKADVRGIVHYNMPKSFESYVQEIGRAGRDGETSHCHLFLDCQGRDVSELQRHTFGNSVDRYTLKKLLHRVFARCKCQQVRKLRDAKQQTQPEASDVTGDERCPDRQCPGHERALPIQDLVQGIDVREEGVETLLCYLELHAPHLLTNLSPVYATCELQCYGGPTQLQALANKCPPVAVAVARKKLRGERVSTSASLQFPVVEVSDCMGWDSGPVKRELRLLQWSMGAAGAKKTGVIVSFTDLAFHVRSCGDVSDSELDDLLDYLHGRVTRQERAELAQLFLLGQRLRSVSHKNFWMCSDEADDARSDRLKKHLDDYFEDKSEGHLEQMELPAQEVDGSSLAQLVSDIRQFIHLYGAEHQLTARAIARVLHGIDSPRFPASTWGRVRRFWRAHVHVHFNTVLREASAVLLSMRS